MAADPQGPPAAGHAGGANGGSLSVHHHVLRFGKRVLIAVVGGLVVMAGIVLLPLPGPGSVVILLGLAILALEFERPRVWLAQLKARGAQLRQRLAARRKERSH